MWGKSASTVFVHFSLFSTVILARVTDKMRPHNVGHS